MNSKATNLFSLSGKVALVTGGAQGLGAAMAAGLAAHGAHTVVVDVVEDAVLETASQLQAAAPNVKVFGWQCDVADRAEVDKTVSGVLEEFNRIDILINNAGTHCRATPVDFDSEEFNKVFAVNIMGCYYMAGAVGQVMIQQRSGSIINVSALGGGLVGLGRGGSVYGMTKGALVALTRDLAAEWGKYNIRVNSIAPGWMKTPITMPLQNDPIKSSKVIERVPLRRWGEADDVAGVAVFLASNCSSYITGHTIPIDGGAANVIELTQE